MTCHLHDADLMPQLQSAVGTTRRKSGDDGFSNIFDAVDIRKVTLLGLLELSAAFDTVDHDIILQRVQTFFGVGGSALEWFRSFLTDRTQVNTLWDRHHHLCCCSN